MSKAEIRNNCKLFLAWCNLLLLEIAKLRPGVFFSVLIWLGNIVLVYNIVILSLLAISFSYFSTLIFLMLSSLDVYFLLTHKKL